MCLDDAIHKWVKIIPVEQNGGQQFLNPADYVTFYL